MSDPNEFKILLATDIHLGYQHKHEVFAYGGPILLPNQMIQGSSIIYLGDFL